MLETVSKTLIYISIYATVLPVIVGVTVLKHLKSYLIPVLFVAVAGSITEVVVFGLIRAGINPWIMNMIYTLTEFTFLLLFYYLFYKPYINTPKIILMLIPLFYIFCALIYITKDEKIYGSYSISIESLIISLFALGSFVFLLRKTMFKNILSHPFFYLNTAFLFYFLGNLSFFALASHIKQMNPSNYVNLRIIHSILNIFFNLLISIGFWKARSEWE